MRRNRMLFAGIFAWAALQVLAFDVQASSIASAELSASGTPITLDQNPIVSAVLSTPTTTNGVPTTRYIFLLDDGTASMDIFGPSGGGGALVGGYVPAVGDALTISGPFSPFSGIPEMGTPTAITKNSSGNPAAVPLVETIPAIAGYTTAPAAGSPYPNFTGRLITFNNVTISSAVAGNYGTANVSVTLKDSTLNSLVGFYNPTTYALANQNLFGTPITTGPVNATGLLQIFQGAPELLIMKLDPVPEPSTLILGMLSFVVLGVAKSYNAARTK
jgi:hypothetical protein